MKYNYIVDNWSGDILSKADDIDFLLSSVYYLKDPSIKVVLFLSGCHNNIDTVRERFKMYSTFFQCYYVGNLNTEYKITSYSSHQVYIERYLSLYKATIEYNIFNEETTNMILLIDSTDCYFFKNIFAYKKWKNNINLFSDGFSCPYWPLKYGSLEPVNSGWIYLIDKYVKLNKHEFKLTDFIICAGTILCKNLTFWKNIISDLTDFIALLYKIQSNNEMITEQGVMNIYYYNKLFKRCVDTDFQLNSGHDSEILACYIKEEDKMYYNEDLNELRVFSHFQTKTIYPVIHHCHYYRYSDDVLNILRKKIEVIRTLNDEI